MSTRFKTIAIVWFLLWQTGSTTAQTLYLDEQFGFALTTGVVFASKPTGAPTVYMDLALELYEPSGTGAPDNRPAIILIHGGGYVNGSRFSGRLLEICERMAKRGYTCVSIDYRLQGDNPIVAAPFLPIGDLYTDVFPGDPKATAAAAAVEDSWAAYQWLLNNAAALKIDPNRIGLGGSSVGAATALYMAYALEELGIAASNTFTSVFDMWGAFYAPSNYIQAGDASLLITHGDNDSMIPVQETYDLDTAANNAGLYCETHIVAGEGHGYDIFTILATPSETIFDRAVMFFYHHLALPGTAYNVPAMGPAGKILVLSILIATGLYARQNKKDAPGAV